MQIRKGIWDGFFATFGFFAVFSLLCPDASLAAAPADGEESNSPAYRLREGSVARSRIVALGRDLVIEGEAQNHAVAIGGDARVSGTISGDLILLGGSAHLAETAVVEGEIFVLGGGLEVESGARIGGRSVAYPDASAAWVALIQGPVLGQSASSPVVLGAKLALLAFWSLLVVLVFSFGSREILATSESIRCEPFRNFFLGLVGVLAMLLTALFISVALSALIGFPFLVLVGVLALALRFWGMVAVFHVVGAFILRWTKTRRPVPLVAATVGVMALGVLKILPWIGVWTWSLATFIAVGATLTTKFGRLEPWIAPAGDSA